MPHLTRSRHDPTVEGPVATAVMCEPPVSGYGSAAPAAAVSKKARRVTQRANATSKSASQLPPSSSSPSSPTSSTGSPSSSSTCDDSDSDAVRMRLRSVSRTKDMALSILERYHSATCTKMYDVEELVDYYFHRRLAAFTAVVISYLPFVITPNQITIFGLGLGWASALCLFDAGMHYPLGWAPNDSFLAASVLMFLWIVSDCADGQVARLCKRGTRTGRILDGVVDGLVIAPNCLAIGFSCAHRYGDPFYVPFAMIAGFALWFHAIVYDKIKNTYTENALPQSECDGETVESVTKEFEEARSKDKFALDSILLGIYVLYVRLQAGLTSDAATKAEATRQHLLANCDDTYRANYIKKYYHVVRLASFMGLSAHVVGLYVAYFAAMYYWDALYYVQLYFLIVLNAVFVAVLFLYFQSGMANQVPLNNAL